MATGKSSSSRKSKRKEQPESREASEGSQVDARAMTPPNMEKKMSEASIIEYTEELENAEAPVPLPPGEYPAEIRAAESKTSPKGNPWIQVQFYINPDEYPADFTQGDPDGTTLSFGRLSPENTVRARFNMKRFCEAIGAPMGRRLDLNEWIGKTAIVQVVNEPYDGVMQASIKKVLPA